MATEHPTKQHAVYINETLKNKGNYNYEQR